MTLQVDEQQSPSEVGYDIEDPPDSSPKKNKKKRDAATLRKAPQGTFFPALSNNDFESRN
jgi:hypothetical protein